jgi:hypothetical protein
MRCSKRFREEAFGCLCISCGTKEPTRCATKCIFVLRSLHRPVQCSGFLLTKGLKEPLHSENGRAAKNAFKPNYC